MKKTVIYNLIVADSRFVLLFSLQSKVKEILKVESTQALHLKTVWLWISIYNNHSKLHNFLIKGNVNINYMKLKEFFFYGFKNHMVLITAQVEHHFSSYYQNFDKFCLKSNNNRISYIKDSDWVWGGWEGLHKSLYYINLRLLCYINNLV